MTFFDPADNELSSVVDVFGGVSSYFFLTVEFDTTVPNFSSFFDIGEDTYMLGQVGLSSYLFNVQTGLVDQQLSTTFNVTIIPEPASLVLLGVACLALAGGDVRRSLA